MIRSHPWIALVGAIVIAIALTALTASIPELQTTIGRLPALLAPIVGWVALFPNEAKKLGADVAARTLYWTHRGERFAVASGIEADFALASREVNEEAPGTITAPGKVLWRRGAPGEPALVEGEVVVRLRDHKERAANLVSFALAQAALGSLAEARPHLDPDVSRASDFALARRLLDRIDEGAAHRLVSEVCLPECQKSERLARLVEQTQRIDDRGLFTRIAIREFVELGQRQGTNLPSAEAAEESVRFVEYLNRIAAKAPNEQLDDKLGFAGQYLKIGVVLVARPDVALVHGSSAYTRRVGEYAKAGIPVVYLASRGTNVEFAHQVALELHNHGNVASVEEFQYQTVHNGIARQTYLARVVVNIRLSRQAERRFQSLRPAPDYRAS